MLFFGHTGLTTGLALLIQKGFLCRTGSPVAGGDPQVKAAGAAGGQAVDYRVVLAGSLLPDIVDKPLGAIITSWFGNGRSVGHTLLFAFMMAAAGLVARKKTDSLAILCLAFGSLVHLLFDRMWEQPAIVFWPLYGFHFPPGNPEEWLDYILYISLPRPRVFVPEILGAIVNGFLLVRLVRRRRLADFLRHGRLS